MFGAHAAEYEGAVSCVSDVEVVHCFECKRCVRADYFPNGRVENISSMFRKEFEQVWQEICGEEGGGGRRERRERNERMGEERGRRKEGREMVSVQRKWDMS